MALKDWLDGSAPPRRGGQGEVRQVRHAEDGRIGALKRLHQGTAVQQERRYRLLIEVSGLRAMNGDGVPHVLEANEQEWRNGKVELYIVMEFINGPTMTELANQSRPSLDQTLSCIARILKILGTGHALPLLHRDLKPDNVIIRNSDWADPILVDLGIAWHGIENHEFDTPVGREMGNRFLRLPEFAPRGEHRDPRSDVAMVGGLLFYMLSGRAPRVPVDHQGKHPHQIEPSGIPAEIVNDRRWPALSRVLTVCFQQSIDARYRDAKEMLTQIISLNEEPTAPLDTFDQEINRLREITSTAEARHRDLARPAMATASAKLYEELNMLWQGVGLMQGGQGPSFKNNGTANEFYCVLSQLDITHPCIVFRHKIQFINGRFTASWSINGDPTSNAYYDGSVADVESLIQACHGRARSLAAAAIGALNTLLASS